MEKRIAKWLMLACWISFVAYLSNSFAVRTVVSETMRLLKKYAL
jgi:hypothetical protein